MNLEVAAVYLPDADEVQVDFSSTLDDLVTVTVADTLTAELQIASVNLIGTQTFSSISTVQATSTYVQPQSRYFLKFRHPHRRRDLWVNITAVYGVDTYTAQVQVGEPASSQTSMDLPENVLSTYNPLHHQSGGPYLPPNKNPVILDPAIQIYVQVYPFSDPTPESDFDGLIYSGGGNRLLLTAHTNQFILQAVNVAPWTEEAYLFLEQAATNIMPNPFFLTQTNGVPSQYQVDAAGALLTQTVEIDPRTSQDANVWAMRFRQNNVLFAFNQAVVSTTSTLAVAPSTQYTFSSYVRINLLTPVTVPTDLILTLDWFDGTSPVGTSTVTLPIADYTTLTLASLTATSPASANGVVPKIAIGSVDSGDDVQLSLLGPQLEVGPFPTSRTSGARLQDQVQINDFDASDQKIRFQMIPGFASSPPVDIALTSGPVIISFTAAGTFKAEVPGQGIAEAALTFAAGDFLDLTISSESGAALVIYKAGDLFAQTSLPTFPSAPGTLTLLGVGVEILTLSVFDRV